MGPFYCPSDHKLYVDLSFYKDMQRKLGGGGDFALGYVLLMKSDIMFKHFSAFLRRCRNCSLRSVRKKPTDFPSNRNFKPTVWQASGATICRGKVFLRREICRKH